MVTMKKSGRFFFFLFTALLLVSESSLSAAAAAAATQDAGLDCFARCMEAGVNGTRGIVPYAQLVNVSTVFATHAQCSPIARALKLLSDFVYQSLLRNIDMSAKTSQAVHLLLTEHPEDPMLDTGIASRSSKFRFHSYSVTPSIIVAQLASPNHAARNMGSLTGNGQLFKISMVLPAKCAQTCGTSPLESLYSDPRIDNPDVVEMSLFSSAIYRFVAEQNQALLMLNFRSFIWNMTEPAWEKRGIAVFPSVAECPSSFSLHSHPSEKSWAQTAQILSIDTQLCPAPATDLSWQQMLGMPCTVQHDLESFHNDILYVVISVHFVIVIIVLIVILWSLLSSKKSTSGPRATLITHVTKQLTIDWDINAEKEHRPGSESVITHTIIPNLTHRFWTRARLLEYFETSHTTFHIFSAERASESIAEKGAEAWLLELARFIFPNIIIARSAHIPSIVQNATDPDDPALVIAHPTVKDAVTFAFAAWTILSTDSNALDSPHSAFAAASGTQHGNAGPRAAFFRKGIDNRFKNLLLDINMIHWSRITYGTSLVTSITKAFNTFYFNRFDSMFEVRILQLFLIIFPFGVLVTLIFLFSVRNAPEHASDVREVLLTSHWITPIAPFLLRITLQSIQWLIFGLFSCTGILTRWRTPGPSRAADQSTSASQSESATPVLNKHPSPRHQAAVPRISLSQVPSRLNSRSQSPTHASSMAQSPLPIPALMSKSQLSPEGSYTGLSLAQMGDSNSVTLSQLAVSLNLSLPNLGNPTGAPPALSTIPDSASASVSAFPSAESNVSNTLNSSTSSSGAKRPLGTPHKDALGQSTATLASNTSAHSSSTSTLVRKPKHQRLHFPGWNVRRAITWVVEMPVCILCFINIVLGFTFWFIRISVLSPGLVVDQFLALVSVFLIVRLYKSGDADVQKIINSLQNHSTKTCADSQQTVTSASSAWGQPLVYTNPATVTAGSAKISLTGNQRWPPTEFIAVPISAWNSMPDYVQMFPPLFVNNHNYRPEKRLLFMTSHSFRKQPDLIQEDRFFVSHPRNCTVYASNIAVKGTGIFEFEVKLAWDPRTHLLDSVAFGWCDGSRIIGLVCHEGELYLASWYTSSQIDPEQGFLSEQRSTQMPTDFHSKHLIPRALDVHDRTVRIRLDVVLQRRAEVTVIIPVPTGSVAEMTASHGHRISTQEEVDSHSARSHSKRKGNSSHHHHHSHSHHQHSQHGHSNSSQHGGNRTHRHRDFGANSDSTHGHSQSHGQYQQQQTTGAQSGSPVTTDAEESDSPRKNPHHVFGTNINNSLHEGASSENGHAVSSAGSNHSKYVLIRQHSGTISYTATDPKTTESHGSESASETSGAEDDDSFSVNSEAAAVGNYVYHSSRLFFGSTTSEFFPVTMWSPQKTLVPKDGATNSPPSKISDKGGSHTPSEFGSAFGSPRRLPVHRHEAESDDQSASFTGRIKRNQRQRSESDTSDDLAVMLGVASDLGSSNIAQSPPYVAAAPVRRPNSPGGVMLTRSVQSLDIVQPLDPGQTDAQPAAIATSPRFSGRQRPIFRSASVGNQPNVTSFNTSNNNNGIGAANAINTGRNSPRASVGGIGIQRVSSVLNVEKEKQTQQHFKEERRFFTIDFRLISRLENEIARSRKSGTGANGFNRGGPSFRGRRRITDTHQRSHLGEPSSASAAPASASAAAAAAAAAAATQARTAVPMASIRRDISIYFLSHVAHGMNYTSKFSTLFRMIQIGYLVFVLQLFAGINNIFSKGSSQPSDDVMRLIAPLVVVLLGAAARNFGASFMLSQDTILGAAQHYLRTRVFEGQRAMTRYLAGERDRLPLRTIALQAAFYLVSRTIVVVNTVTFFSMTAVLGGKSGIFAPFLPSWNFFSPLFIP